MGRSFGSIAIPVYISGPRSNMEQPGNGRSSGVKEAALPRVVAGKAGQVAVAYYGSLNSPGAPFPANCTNGPISCPEWQHVTRNMYITETFDALEAQPVFGALL